MAFVCTVCFNIDYEVDNETGSMRCNGCNTLSQDFVNEAPGDEAAGVTLFMSRNIAAAGFIRESGVKLRNYDGKVAEIEKESKRNLRGIRLEDAALALSLAYCDYLQTILEWQCQVLIKEMGVSDELKGVAGELWLKFVEKSEVLDPSFVHTSVEERVRRRKERHPACKRKGKGSAEVEEMQGGEGTSRGGGDGGDDDAGDMVQEGDEGVEEEPNLFAEGGGEEYNTGAGLGGGCKFADWHDARAPHGGTYAHVWVSEMKLRIPLAVTLAILFLACHWLREPVLPTDLVQLQLENRIPYMAAWKLLPDPRNFSGLPELDRLLQVLREHGVMRPISFCSARKIEFWGAEVASKLALDLPPVNYHLLAIRFLQDLRLPLAPLLPIVERLMDLLVPSPLWLTTWVGALPARVTVMALVLLALKLHCGLTTAFSEGGGDPPGAQKHHCTVQQSAFWCKWRGLEEGTRVSLFGNGCWARADDTGGGGEWEGASAEEQREVVLGLGVRRRVASFPGDSTAGGASYSRGELEEYFNYCHNFVLRSTSCPSYMADQSAKLWKAFQQSAGGEGGKGKEEWEAALRGRASIAEEMERVGCVRAPPMEEELRRWQYVRYTSFVGPRIFSEAVAHADFFVAVHTCARVVGVPWKTLFSVLCENEQKLVEVEFNLEKMARKSNLTLYSGEG